MRPDRDIHWDMCNDRRPADVLPMERIRQALNQDCDIFQFIRSRFSCTRYAHENSRYTCIHHWHRNVVNLQRVEAEKTSNCTPSEARNLLKLQTTPALAFTLSIMRIL